LRYFNTSPEVILVTVMADIRYPLSRRPVEDPLFGLGIDVYHETVPRWWRQFGPIFAPETRNKRSAVLLA
jgi:transposase-like protein